MGQVYLFAAGLQVRYSNAMRIAENHQDVLYSPLTVQERWAVLKWMRQAPDAQVIGFLEGMFPVTIESERERELQEALASMEASS